MPLTAAIKRIAAIARDLDDQRPFSFQGDAVHAKMPMGIAGRAVSEEFPVLEDAIKRGSRDADLGFLPRQGNDEKERNVQGFEVRLAPNRTGIRKGVGHKV